MFEHVPYPSLHDKTGFHSYQKTAYPMAGAGKVLVQPNYPTRWAHWCSWASRVCLAMLRPAAIFWVEPRFSGLCFAGCGGRWRLNEGEFGCAETAGGV